eukprot:304102-Chlamydomonas_euryale.AAC.4
MRCRWCDAATKRVWGMGTRAYDIRSFTHPHRSVSASSQQHESISTLRPDRACAIAAGALPHTSHTQHTLSGRHTFARISVTKSSARDSCWCDPHWLIIVV